MGLDLEAAELLVCLECRRRSHPESETSESCAQYGTWLIPARSHARSMSADMLTWAPKPEEFSEPRLEANAAIVDVASVNDHLGKGAEV